MKKSLIISGIISLCLFTATGCSNSIPEMDDETRELVVEYAAATVRKYNKNQQPKLLEYEEIEVPAEETDVNTEQEMSAEGASAEEAGTSESASAEESSSLQPDSNVEIIEQGTSEEAAPPASLEEILQLEEMSLSYEGYETKSYYPEDGENIYFIMNATEGNQLLVLKFKLQNLGQNEKTVDIIGKGLRYKIVVNDETKNALKTMLLNDLANYQGTIAQGAEEELVLICEISEEQAGQINSLSIIVKNADETATISLN